MFTGRDLFDFALIATRDPAAIDRIKPILRAQRTAIRERLATGDKALRTAFSALDTLGFSPTYDECVRIVADALDEAGP